MASKSKKRTQSKRTKKTAKKSGESFVLDEIIIWVMLAVSILLLISNFGFGGRVGAAVSSLLVEAFGGGEYLFPFLLFVLTAFTITNKRNAAAYVKSAAAVILFVLICGMFEMISAAGGALGVIGTYVVLVIFMIICMVVITGKSALKGVKKQSGRAYARAKSGNARRREMARERQELRKKEAAKEAKAGKEPKRTRRKDRHVEGVSFDTTLARKSPDVRELKPAEDILKPAESPKNQTAYDEEKPPEMKEPEFVINRGVQPEPEDSDEFADFAEDVKETVPEVRQSEIQNGFCGDSEGDGEY